MQRFPCGRGDGVIHAFSDLDWAGCSKSRMLTSGGVLLTEDRALKHWSSPQKAIAMSSTEAALYGAVCTISEARALKSFGKDFGEGLRTVAWVDAQATVGSSFRSGICRQRRIEPQSC